MKSDRAPAGKRVRPKRRKPATSAVDGTTDRRIDRLLTLLAENPMIVISGQKIAREIGVTRSSVWRWTQRLRALGVRVKGHPRTGYRIERVPDVLSPSLLRRELRHSIFGKHIYHFFKTSSTNQVAFELGLAGQPHGTVVIAEEQTAGRGRAGRSWHSEKTAGIYVSVLLRPPVSPLAAPAIPLLAGLAARDAILEAIGVTADLRWPNDLLLGGKKFGGILAEMQAEPDRIRFLVLGLGIDVNHAAMPADLAAIATSLRMVTGKVQSRMAILVRLLLSLETYYNRFLAEGPQPIVERFSEVSSFAKGKRVRVNTAKESYTGVTDGLEPNGLLRVMRDQGRDQGRDDGPEAGRVEIVVSGDVREAL